MVDSKLFSLLIATSLLYFHLIQAINLTSHTNLKEKSKSGEKINPKIAIFTNHKPNTVEKEEISTNNDSEKDTKELKKESVTKENISNNHKPIIPEKEAISASDNTDTDTKELKEEPVTKGTISKDHKPIIPEKEVISASDDTDTDTKGLNKESVTKETISEDDKLITLEKEVISAINDSNINNKEINEDSVSKETHSNKKKPILVSHKPTPEKEAIQNEESISKETISKEKLSIPISHKSKENEDVSASNETYLSDLKANASSGEVKDSSIASGYCEAIYPAKKQFSKEFFFRTEDVNNYNYFADLNWGRIYFDLKKVGHEKSSTFIALTRTTSLEEPSYIIHIGANKNQETHIRHGKDGIIVATASTSGILHKYRKVRLWLEWDCGKISIGYDGSPAFLAWEDTKPFGIQYVLIDNIGAIWYFNDYKQVKSVPGEGLYYAVNQIVDFEFKGAKDSYVGFFGSSVPSIPIHQVLIGGEKGSYSYLFSHQDQSTESLKSASETLGITSATEFRSFRIVRSNGYVLVYDFKSHQPFIPILSFEEQGNDPIGAVGFRTSNGTAGMWKIKRACSIVSV